MSSISADDAAMMRLVTEIARGLVGESDAIQVDVRLQDASRCVRLRVGPDEFGKLLGSHGRTAKSIRTILAAAGHRLQQRYTLDLAEDSKVP